MKLKEKQITWLIYSIAFLAILLRVVIWFQQRDLFIDEANVARNLYEKSFLDLTEILDYQQFAPPLFLWASKLSSILFGFNEFSLRFFPLLCAIASVMLFIHVCRFFFVEKPIVIYPLLLLSSAFILLHFNTELKQYSSDFLVTLILLYAAIKTNYKQLKRSFVFFWIIVGSLTIWLSMPSVFILCSISIYWFVQNLSTKKYKDLFFISIAPFLWLIEFALYYFFILKNQISSDYLQSYHSDAFLSLSNMQHNFSLALSIVKELSGNFFLSVVVNCFLLFLGTTNALYTLRWKSILLLLPFILLFIASLLHLYAIVPRLVLFIQPITLLLIGVGLSLVVKNSNVVFRSLVVFFLGYSIYLQHNFKYFYTKMAFQEIRELMKVEEDSKISRPLFVFHGAKPAFIFYTQMHDNKELFKNIEARSHILEWNDSYKAASNRLNQNEVFSVLLCSFYPSDIEKLDTELINNKLVYEKTAEGCLLRRYKKMEN